MAPAVGAAPDHVDLSSDDEEEEECEEGHGEGDESEEYSSGDEGSDGSELESDDYLDEDHEDEEGDGDDEEEEEEEERGATIRKRKRKGNTFGGEDDVDDGGEEELCHKVVSMLQRRKDLSMLRLDECKSYLRKHGLRLTGSKSVCVQRIQEHWRLRHGNGEKLYPKSSFVINCTGDVCTGDVILFKQRVYHKFDIVRKGGNFIGRRTVAGKVVKESYGAVKKQHTFTVEVLWSKGVKPLPALHPLLVKGRNLYRLRTFRQHWEDEMERSKVLAEKHKRGAAARHARATGKAKYVKQGPKCHKKPHDRREVMTMWKEEVKHKATTKRHKKHPYVGSSVAKPRAVEPVVSHSVYRLPHTKEVQREDLLPWSMDHRESRAAFHAKRWLLHSSTYEAGSSSTMRGELYNQALSRTTFNNPYSNHWVQFGLNNSSPPLSQVHFGESFKVPSGMHSARWKGVFYCLTPGCQELAADGCAISCCWMCCRRVGRQCDRHK